MHLLSSVYMSSAKWLQQCSPQALQLSSLAHSLQQIFVLLARMNVCATILLALVGARA